VITLSLVVYSEARFKVSKFLSTGLPKWSSSSNGFHRLPLPALCLSSSRHASLLFRTLLFTRWLPIGPATDFSRACIRTSVLSTRVETLTVIHRPRPLKIKGHPWDPPWDQDSLLFSQLCGIPVPYVMVVPRIDVFP